MQSSLDITGAFKVGSWIVSIDTHNREQLLKTCQEWTGDHTDLLIDELTNLITGHSTLNIELVRTDIDKLVYACAVLSKYRSCPCVALSTGLSLI